MVLTPGEYQPIMIKDVSSGNWLLRMSVMASDSKAHDISYGLKLITALALRVLYGNNRILWLSPLLFIYGFLLLLASDVVASTYRIGNIAWGWYLIPATFIVLFESLNQFTYWFAKRSRKQAIIIKAVCFWALLTFLCVSVTLIEFQQGTKDGVWHFTDKWSAVLWYLCFAWLLPAYSFSPDFRFFVLYGEFSGMRREK